MHVCREPDPRATPVYYRAHRMKPCMAAFPLPQTIDWLYIGGCISLVPLSIDVLLGRMLLPCARCLCVCRVVVRLVGQMVQSTECWRTINSEHLAVVRVTVYAYTHMLYSCLCCAKHTQKNTSARNSAIDHAGIMHHCRALEGPSKDAQHSALLGTGCYPNRKLSCCVRH